jgi:hypothetical protein
MGRIFHRQYPFSQAQLSAAACNILLQPFYIVRGGVLVTEKPFKIAGKGFAITGKPCQLL